MHFISVPFILNYSHIFNTLSSSLPQVEKSLPMTSVIDPTFNANPQGKTFHSYYYNGLYHPVVQDF